MSGNFRPGDTMLSE